MLGFGTFVVPRGGNNLIKISGDGSSVVGALMAIRERIIVNRKWFEAMIRDRTVMSPTEIGFMPLLRDAAASKQNLCRAHF